MEATCKRAIRSEVKITACLRILGSGTNVNDMDDSAQMGRHSIRISFHLFCHHIRFQYGATYLDVCSTQGDLATVKSRYVVAGFLDCAGFESDYCKRTWKNCLLELKGQYHNLKEFNFVKIEVEAWCDRYLYVWKWFSGDEAQIMTRLRCPSLLCFGTFDWGYMRSNYINATI